MLTFCCLKLIRVHYHNKELLFIVKILPPCVFCKITSKVFMLGHGKKTTNIAKALWLAMAIKTSLWLQILISEKHTWHMHCFCYIDLLPGNELVKTTMTILTCLGGLRWPVTCFYRQLSIGFHILCPPFTSFSYQVHSRHPENGGIKVSRSKSGGKEIYYICFEYLTPNFFVDLGKKSEKLLFIWVPVCVCSGHIITAVKQLLNNL